ncbi:hypothetical protein Tco_0888143 [Tanacetum coccineum]
MVMTEADLEEDTQQTSSQGTYKIITNDAHVTHPAVSKDLQQSSSISGDLVSKFITPPPETKTGSVIAETQVSASTIPHPSTQSIQPLQQTSGPTIATTTPTLTLPNIPNFASLFGFEERVSTLEMEISEFKQTNQFATVVSSIPSIVDNYLDSKMKDAVDVAIQLKSNILREETQAENEAFIKNIDEHMQKIIKKQVKSQVKEQVSNIMLQIEKWKAISQSTDLMTKRIFIKHWLKLMIVKNSYLTLMEILSLSKDDEMKRIKIKNPPLDQTGGSKRRRSGKEHESTSAPKEKTSKTTGKSTEGSKSHHKSAGKSAQAEESMHTTKDLEEPAHPKFVIGATKDQPDKEISQHADWFQKPAKPPTPDSDWNKTLPIAHGPVQPWLSSLAQMQDPRKSFNELMDTPLDFSAFVMNRLKVDTLTLKLLASLIFELMKGSCKSLVELEYFFEEVYNATTDQLDCNNLDGKQYPHDLRKPLPLIPNSRGRRVIPFNHFINNDTETTEDQTHPKTLPTRASLLSTHLNYGQLAKLLLVIRAFSGVNVCAAVRSEGWSSAWGSWLRCYWEYACDVYSKRRIIAVTKLQIMEWHNYKHLDWITIRRDDDKLYTFKEGDFNRLRIQDIEDMLLLLVQGKLTNLTVEERLAFNVSLRMFTRSIVIQRCVEDLQLGNKDKKNRLMRIDELHKFSNGTLNDVRTALNDRLKGIRMKCLPQTIWRQSDRDKA